MMLANLMDTPTLDCHALLGRGKAYRVPSVQRDYCWTLKQWEDLWSDIVALREDRARRHYMGAIVIKAISDRVFALIDGQQRLVTLSLVVLSVIQRLEDIAATGIDAEANRERSELIRDRYVAETDPASLREYSRLALNGTNGPFYQDVLIQLREPHNSLGLSPSNQRLWEAFRYFRARLDDAIAARDDGRAVASVVAETIARGLLFTVTSVDDRMNASTLFETVNSRGIRRTTTDPPQTELAK